MNVSIGYHEPANAFCLFNGKGVALHVAIDVGRPMKLVMRWTAIVDIVGTLVAFMARWLEADEAILHCFKTVVNTFFSAVFSRPTLL